MSKLKSRIKHISLDFMGTEWQDCYIDFRALTWADASKLQVDDLNERQAARVLLDTLKGAFVSGRGIGEDGQMIELEADDLDDLDLESIAQVTRGLTGQINPNA